MHKMNGPEKWKTQIIKLTIFFFVNREIKSRSGIHKIVTSEILQFLFLMRIIAILNIDIKISANDNQIDV
jgi:hypothetical protein